jgi:hypothetical protein
MKKQLLHLLIIPIIAITAFSCKLDAPIYPTKTATANGTDTSFSSIINNPNLSGTYYLLSDYSEDFDAKTDSPYAKTKKYPALFKRIIFNDSTKTAIVTFYVDSAVNFTYQLTSESNKTYITFNKDIFPRSISYKIEITRLSNNSMIWKAKDPATFSFGSAAVYMGYMVTFTKE